MNRDADADRHGERFRICTSRSSCWKRFARASRPSPGISAASWTHAHIDHFGGLPEIVRRTAPRWPCTPSIAAAVEADERAARATSLRSVSPAGAPCRREIRGTHTARSSVAVDRELIDGEWSVSRHPYARHSPGHVRLAVGDILLAGTISWRTVSQLWPESVAAYTGLGHYLDSLKRIQRCGPFRLAMGGHEPVIHDLAHRLEEIRAAHQRRLERLLEILSGAPEPLCVDQLSERMYSRQRGYPALLALTDVGARVETDCRIIADIEHLAEQMSRVPLLPGMSRIPEP